jgi:uncharacterized protein
MEYIILLISIGIFAGIFAGLLGIGGGFLMVPLQYFLLISNGVDHDLALRISLGTSLAIIIPTALAGAYNHQRKLKDILWVGIFLGIFGMIGGIFGGITSSYIPSSILKFILGIFLIFIAIIMFLKRSERKMDFTPEVHENSSNSLDSGHFKDINNIEDINDINVNNANITDANIDDKDIKNNYIKQNYIGVNKDPENSNDNNKFINNIYNKLKISPPLVILLGIVVGFFSGLLGLGGGIFLVPALTFLGFSMRKSIGVSSIFISLTSIGGTLSYIFTGLSVNTFPYSLGYVSLVNFGTIAIFSIPMAYIGAKLAYRIPENILRYIFAILMIYIGIRMIGFDPITYLLG